MSFRKAILWSLGAVALAGGLAGFRLWSFKSHKAKTAEPINWQFDFDDSGAIAGVVDPAGQSAQVRFERDDSKGVRRVVKELPGGLKVTADIDTYGRIAKVTDPAGTVQYDYDGYNRVLRVRRDGWPSLSYTYDTLDRVTAVSPGEKRSTRYTYDYLGRLAAIETPAGPVTYRYARLEGGKRLVIRTLPNQARSEWEYLPGEGIGSITHVSADNTIIQRFIYAYRPDGLLAGVTEQSDTDTKNLTLQYDNVQRLVSVDHSQKGATTYKYDKFGNRTEVAASGAGPIGARYDWAGRMVEYEGQPCSHDSARSLTAYAHAEGKAKATFTYSPRNAIASVRRDAATVTYQQDGGGALIARTAGGHTTRFVLDARADTWRPVLAIDDQDRQTLYVWEGNTPLAAIGEERVEFFLTDQVGSIRGILDRAGKVAARFDYDPFGVPSSGPDTGAPRPGYAGLFYDPEARLYLALDRAYDPALGRFLQRSPRRSVPMGAQLGLSAYTYCGDDPANLVDHSGSDPRPAGVVRLLGDVIASDAWEIHAAMARLAGMDYGKGASLSLEQSPPGSVTAPAPLEVVGEKSGSLPTQRDYLALEYTAFIDPNATPHQQAEAFQQLGEEAALNGLDARVRSVTAPPARSRGGQKAAALMNWELIRDQSERQSRRRKILDFLLKVQEKSDKIKEQTGQVGTPQGG